MNDQLLILIVLLVSGLTLCCLLFLAFYLFRLRRIHGNSSLISLTQISSGDSKELISSGLSATTIRDNVLTRLSFRESMDITHFATASQESAISHLTQTVAGRLGDGVEVVISGFNLAESWATATSDMIPEFELTLAGELQELSAVAELLESKSSLISKKYSDLSVAPTVEGIKMVVEEYKKLLPLSLDN